jgi:hypothetical protein
MRYNTTVLLSFLLLLGYSCSPDRGNTVKNKQGYINVTKGSGFDFSNVLDEQNMTNPFNYINAYNGGGVAIGDINNDGLQDIFMTSNMGQSKLFLNKGNLQFSDITLSAGTGTTGWCTGVTMADINQDGWLDIYVCRSYHDAPQDRANLLFINNKDNSFSEQGSRYGIADENYSIGASFFDYDLDGDLDLIVANHPRFRLVPLNVHYNNWKNPTKEFSNRLFRNDGTTYTEVTEAAGILSYGFSLSLTTSDINNDNYPDIFITVDHDEPDLIFKNNQDGTFTNIVDSALKSSTLSSMGIDVGDLNNDAFPDVVVAEMLSTDHYLEKVNMSMQSVDRFNYLVDTMGYKYYQMHNFLYANNGNNTFSDVSQLAGVHKSDWSWASLFMDYNNDGYQDLFFANGFYKDIYHRDKKKKLDSVMMTLNGDMEKMNKVAKDYAINASQTKISNLLFTNNGDYNFSSAAKDLGLQEKTITTGSAYGDLDNDGDLDLVVSNLGEASFLYENISTGNNYLRVNLTLSTQQPRLGSKISIKVNGEKQYRELLSTRGYQSSCEPIAHFGLGKNTTVDELIVTWPNGKSQILKNIEANQTIQLDYADANQKVAAVATTPLFATTTAAELGITYQQKENVYNDYDDQVLLPHKLSEYGPFISKADINADGLEDIYIGSPHNQESAIYVQNKNGQFAKKENSIFNTDKMYEDGHSLFLDIDNDKDQDLFVTSTGYEFDNNKKQYRPRVYLNDGRGNFTKSNSAVEGYAESASCVTAADFDKDGDFDLFVGGRLDPKKYPNPGTSALLINNGKGKFSNKITDLSEGLEKFGMVRDAIWTDFNKDGEIDLIVVGEWTKIGFFENQSGKLIDKSSTYFDESITGWWNTISISDLDRDGNEDLVLGNLGYNYKYKASKSEPFYIYGKDFDNSGTCDIVLGAHYGDVVYPVRGKNCSQEQIPSLEKKFETFGNYALADIDKVYGEDLKSALSYQATEFGSMILFKNNIGTYEMQLLPRLTQTSPINGIVINDYNKDGKPDLIVAGNLYQSEIETGRADSGTGYVLLNQGDRRFEALATRKSGIYLPEDVKCLEQIKIGNEKAILVGINKGPIKLIKPNIN